MIARLVAWSACHRWLVTGLVIALAVSGELARRAVPRDVLPELADPRIALVVDWNGHPAAEVAARIARPLTATLEGLAGSTAVRGSSMSDLAHVDVVFSSGADLVKGRRDILDRLSEVRSRLPSTARIQVGPLASSTGWVLQYVLVDPTHVENPVGLRRLQDERVRPVLAAVAGVAEVASVGGQKQEVSIDVRSDQLREHALAFSDVSSRVQSAFAAEAPRGLAELQSLSIPVEGGSVPLSDVARVGVDRAMPGGLADFQGLYSAVGGIVVVERSAHLPTVLGAVHRALGQVRSGLPGGVKLVTVYDRAEVVDRIQHTLNRALAEEIAVVALVILLFLLHPASALVPLLTLPVVVLLTYLAMWALGIPATLMSLGGIGIALGLAVDADVVALEACHRRLEVLPAGAPNDERRRALLAAAGSFGPAILTALCISALSFLPVLAFSGETGRLLRPLALSKTLVIGAAALVALTLAPALRDLLLHGPVRPELANPITRTLVQAYRPFVQFALGRPALTLLLAGVALASAVPIALRLGAEFLPRVDEGDLLFMPTTQPGAPAHELEAQLRLQDRALSGVPEVATVAGKLGRADTATDPAPLSMAETVLQLRPRAQWPAVAVPRWYSGWAPGPLRRVLGLLWPEERPSTTSEPIERLDRAARLPGWRSAWTAPARARMDMLTTGIRTPVGIRIVSRDLARLDRLGATLRSMAAGVSGTRSAVLESQGGEAWPRFVPQSGAAELFGADPALVEATAELLLTGGQVGQLEVQGRPVPVRLTLERRAREPTDQLREATVRAKQASGEPVPLALLGRPGYAMTPALVRTEGGELVSYVHLDVEEGTELLAYVDRLDKALAQARASGEVTLEPGEHIDWVGQYRLITDGTRRLRWIVPLVLLSMLALLYLQFRNLTESLLVLASVPFALVGSVWTLFWLGYPLSAPVWVGLLSVAGLAMQTGVVMVVYIDDAFYRRLAEGRLRTRADIIEAHAEGTVRRLRPKLMTVGTMAAGLLPLLWAEGAGAEILRRIAAPMIGGLVTSAFLTLEVLPVLYTLWRVRQLRQAERLGRASLGCVRAGSCLGLQPDLGRHRGHPVGVDKKEHVIPGSGQVGIGRPGHVERSAPDGEGQRHVPLAHVEGVGHRPEAKEGDAGDARCVRCLDGEALAEGDGGGCRDDHRAWTLEEVRGSEELGVELVGGQRVVVEPSPAQQHHSPVGEQRRLRVVQAGGVHGGERGPCLGGGRPQLGLHDCVGSVGGGRGGSSPGGQDGTVGEEGQGVVGAREGHRPNLPPDGSGLVHVQDVGGGDGGSGRLIGIHRLAGLEDLPGPVHRGTSALGRRSPTGVQVWALTFRI